MTVPQALPAPLYSRARSGPTHSLTFGDNEVRFVIQAGQAWLSAYDAARCLRIDDGKGATLRRRLGKLAETDQRRIRMITAGGLQPVLAVSLAGLTALARMKDGKNDRAFRAWIKAEAEPAIREALVIASPDELRPETVAGEALISLPASIASALRRLAADIEARAAPAARLASASDHRSELVPASTLEI